MSPGELASVLATAYDYDAEHRVHVARGAKAFAYSDGAEAEAYVAQAVRGASDIAIGSPELAAAIRDWPSQYHLDAARANLLRPIGAPAAGSTVLEIGAGCGAITRFLGESGATVLAVEGSLARARVAASRCRDLDNVVVLCDNFDAVEIAARFDLVTLIGVLEYSRLYMAGDDPVQTLLERARARLAPGGRLVVAIENQLGGKYLAGAPEDHLNEPWVGVTGGYGADTPVTFGRRELGERLAGAGFAATEFLYPFPDYKLPAAVVTEAGFAHPRFNASDLVATAHPHRRGHDALPAFSESLARDVLVRNGLGGDTANSFLCVAGEKRGPESDTLAWAYTVGRDRPYAGEARFVAEADEVVVQRRALYPERAGSASGQARVAREGYLQGELLYRGLQRVVARRGWSVEAVAEWAAPWVAFLRERARGDTLPPEFFDCTPFNIVRDASGRLRAFDLEWSAGNEGPSVEQVVFRGLYNGLLRVDFTAAPAAGVPTHIPTLCAATMHRLGFAAVPDQIHAWIAHDYALTGRIAGIPRPGVLPDLPSLRVAGAVEVTPAPSPPSMDDALLARLASRQRELDSILARPHHRVASWLGDLVEPFPQLRAMARAPFEALAGRAPRIGAIVHLFYAELWSELRDYLARVPSLERAYVSIAEGAPAELEARIAADFPGARVRRVPNRGRDVLPFLQFLDEARRDGIELVCKIHGKRSPHVATGEAWRRDMLGKLLGSEADVRAIVERFRADPKLGIVGPGGHVVPGSYYWERNAARVQALAGRMGEATVGDFRYVAGSMFWARVAALAPLLELNLGPQDFEAEAGAADGTMAHALERCFPIAARVAGMRAAETPNTTGTTIRDFAP